MAGRLGVVWLVLGERSCMLKGLLEMAGHQFSLPTAASLLVAPSQAGAVGMAGSAATSCLLHPTAFSCPSSLVQCPAARMPACRMTWPAAGTSRSPPSWIA